MARPYLQLPPGVTIDIVLAPKSFLPGVPKWRQDVDDLIQAAWSYPYWPEARAQHLELITKSLERAFPGRLPAPVTPIHRTNRKQRRAKGRKNKGVKR